MFVHPLPELYATAVAAVEQWRYEPTLVNGEAVTVVMTVTIDFFLQSGTMLPAVSRRSRGRNGRNRRRAPAGGGAATEGEQDGVIFGQVLDTTGEPLPGTTIEAATPAVTRAAIGVADRQGELPHVESAAGHVTFSLSGFSSVIRNEVGVGSGLASRVDADLAVGGTDSVEFSGPQGGTAGGA